MSLLNDATASPSVTSASHPDLRRSQRGHAVLPRRLLGNYAEEIRTRYWQGVWPRAPRNHSEADLGEIVDRLLEVRRPRAAFHAVHLDWDRLQTSRLKRLLTDVATVDAEPVDTFQPSPHDISAALDSLDGRVGVTQDDMAQLEFRFISALDRTGHGIQNLERQVAESPLLFVQAVVLMYKRRDDGEDPPEWRIDDSERRAAVASTMHRLLDRIKRIPGTNGDDEIIADDLTAWLTQVRELCAVYGRAEVGDHSIGELLSKAPAEGNGAWPCLPVCEAMERIASPRFAEASSPAFATVAGRCSAVKAAHRNASRRPIPRLVSATGLRVSLRC